MKKKKLLLLLVCIATVFSGVKAQDLITVFEANSSDWLTSNLLKNETKSVGDNILLTGDISVQSDGSLQLGSGSWSEPSGIPTNRNIKITQSFSSGGKITFTGSVNKSRFNIIITDKNDNVVVSKTTSISMGNTSPLSTYELNDTFNGVYNIYIGRNSSSYNFVGIKIETYETGEIKDNTLHSLIVNEQEIAITDEMNVVIPYSCVEETIPVEFTVNSEAIVTIDDVSVSADVDGLVRTFVSIGNHSIIVQLGSDTKEYLLNISKAGRTVATLIEESRNKIWDFTVWSQETMDALAAAESGWTASDATRYQNSGAYSAGSLKVGENDIKETIGLSFPAESSAKKTSIRYSGSQLGLQLGGAREVTLSEPLENGQKIKVVLDSSNNTERGIESVVNLQGACGSGTYGTKNVVYIFTVITDGQVKFKSSDGIILKSIEVISEYSLALNSGNLANRTNIKLGGDIIDDDIALLKVTNLTSIDVTKALSVADGLSSANPNCLIYASSVLAETNNLIVDGEAENIALIDGYEFNCPAAFNAQAISYTRSFPAAGMASLCLPFAVSEIPSGIVPQKFIGSEGIVVNFEEVASLDANTPYIATVEAKENVIFTGSGEVPATALVDVNGGSTDYTFKGIFSNVSAGSVTGLFTLRADGTGFGRATESATILPFRAYMEENASTPSATRLLTIGNGDGGATGMTAAESAENSLSIYAVDGKVIVRVAAPRVVNVYTASGQLVSIQRLEAGENVINGLAKGVYLIENNKVVVK